MNLNRIISVVFVCSFVFTLPIAGQDFNSNQSGRISDGSKSNELAQNTEVFGKEIRSEGLFLRESEIQIQQAVTIPDLASLRLKNKIIPLTNPVYQLLDYFETKGELGFLPQAKPYTKVYIAELLIQLVAKDNLSDREKRLVQLQLADITQDTNGLKIYKQVCLK